jgi:hypothetical protein
MTLNKWYQNMILNDILIWRALSAVRRYLNNISYLFLFNGLNSQCSVIIDSWIILCQYAARFKANAHLVHQQKFGIKINISIAVQHAFVKLFLPAHRQISTHKDLSPRAKHQG